MLGLAFALLILQASDPNPVCEVGKAAIGEFLKPPSAGTDVFYGKTDLKEADLLDACPDLTAQLPSGYPIADDEARRRTSELGFERLGKPASIVSIGVPKISADGQSATVDIGIVCGGLCGTGHQATYVRTPNGWKREGGMLLIWVS